VFDSDPTGALLAFQPPALTNDWQDAVLEARGELDASRPADALTDVGRGLQLALTSAGFPGKALGDQMKALERSALFKGLDQKIAEVVSSLGDWIAGARNTRSDSHPGSEATEEEVLFAIRALAAVAWLLEARASETS
jgi:hypothetical protein